MFILFYKLSLYLIHVIIWFLGINEKFYDLLLKLQLYNNTSVFIYTSVFKDLRATIKYTQIHV